MCVTIFRLQNYCSKLSQNGSVAFFFEKNNLLPFIILPAKLLKKFELYKFFGHEMKMKCILQAKIKK